MPRFHSAKLLSRRQWSDDLCSITLDKILDFAPGQFVNLAAARGSTAAFRPYSLASAPGENCEFLITRVEGGALSPSLFELKGGDELGLETTPEGLFQLRFVPAVPEMWFLSTGSGLGPFVSMIRDPATWEKFERIIMVHGVRQHEQLAYLSSDFDAVPRGALTWIPVLSRERNPIFLNGRIPALIESGSLEKTAGISFEEKRCHIMICGNPEMIKDTTAVLKAKGLRKHRQRKPGHWSTEKYR